MTPQRAKSSATGLFRTNTVLTNRFRTDPVLPLALPGCFPCRSA
jgi:hypothetical protein